MTNDLLAYINTHAPDIRGRLEANAPLAPYTWFRVGGPAQVLFTPADEADLAYMLNTLPKDVPITVLGLGSNVIIRDGGILGLVIRLSAKAFGNIEVFEGVKVRVGAAVPDMKLAKHIAQEGVAGLAFYRGIPGSVGGAIRMNAGAHGGETKDVVTKVRAVTRAGEIIELTPDRLGFSYRHCSAPLDLIFTQVEMQGQAADPAEIYEQMEAITKAREESQPIREKTGGSTFKNPSGLKAWQCIDQAGCRGLVQGDAQVSLMHCNFLINRGNATAHDIETLGDEVQARVRAKLGVELAWEIKRIGVRG